MLKFKATATIEYDCLFSDEQEKVIIETAKRFKEEFKKEMGYDTFNKYYLNKAISWLYFNSDIINFDLYKNASESDFNTDEIDFNCYIDKSGNELDSIDELF